MSLELVRWRGIRNEWYWYGDQEMLHRRFYPGSGLVTWSGDDGRLKNIVDELEAARIQALQPDGCERFGSARDGAWSLWLGPRTVIFWDSGLITSGRDFHAAEIKFNTQASAFTWLFTGRPA
jgi:hypothetical protein